MRWWNQLPWVYKAITTAANKSTTNCVGPNFNRDVYAVDKISVAENQTLGWIDQFLLLSLPLVFFSFFFLFFKMIFSHILLLFKYSGLHFLSTIPFHPNHPHFPPSILPSFGIVHVSFIHVPENPSPFSPHYPLPPPLWLLSDCS